MGAKAPRRQVHRVCKVEKNKSKSLKKMTFGSCPSRLDRRDGFDDVGFSRPKPERETVPPSFVFRTKSTSRLVYTTHYCCKVTICFRIRYVYIDTLRMLSRARRPFCFCGRERKEDAEVSSGKVLSYCSPIVTSASFETRSTNSRSTNSDETQIYRS